MRLKTWVLLIESPQQTSKSAMDRRYHLHIQSILDGLQQVLLAFGKLKSVIYLHNRSSRYVSNPNSESLSETSLTTSFISVRQF